jgi:hypothetical protein
MSPVITPPASTLGSSVSSAEIDNDSIVNADIKTDAAIAFSKLAALTDGNILVGNASNVAASVAVSGPVTISNAGVTSLSFTGYAGAIATSSTDGLVLSGNGGADTLNLSSTTAGVGITIGGDTSWVRSAANTWLTSDNVTLDNGSLELTGGGATCTAPKLRSTGETEIDGALNHDGSTVGFYGTAPVAKQTGVAVDATGIHAALVNLGLIAA